MYVTGGAQGSQQINELAGEVLPWLLPQANVVHQCGPDNVESLRARTAGLPSELAGRYTWPGSSVRNCRTAVLIEAGTALHIGRPAQ